MFGLAFVALATPVKDVLMDLEELRSNLSAIDRQLVELIAERQKIVADIGRSKRTTGAGTRDYARE